MCDMNKICELHGVRVSPPTVDYRGKLVYKAEITDAMTMVVVAREMVNARCKPHAAMSKWNDATVTLTERRRGEVWFFKFYGRDRVHAEDVLTDVLDAIQPHCQYQEMLDL